MPMTPTQNVDPTRASAALPCHMSADDSRGEMAKNEKKTGKRRRIDTYTSGEQVPPYGATLDALRCNGTARSLRRWAKDDFSSGAGARGDMTEGYSQQQLHDRSRRYPCDEALQWDYLQLR